jgi:hypothetical protein
VLLDLLAEPVFADLCVLVDLVFCVFAVLVVESFAPEPLANAGMVNPITTSDANIILSSFFMFILLLRFAYALLKARLGPSRSVS